MEKRAFPTPFGEIWLWGDAAAFSDDRPVVLVITGAFNNERSAVFALQAALPEAAVLIGHLPGNHCPPTVPQSVGGYAAAYGLVAKELARPLVAVGASVGGLVAMALRAPNLRGIVALEPPIRTGKLWPLLPSFRQRLGQDPENALLKEFLWSVLGVSAEDHEDRNYEHMLAQLATPTLVLLGAEPLYPERKLAGVPSLVDEPERDILRRHPFIRTTLVQGVGHNIPGYALHAVVDRTRSLIRSILAASPPSP